MDIPVPEVFKDLQGKSSAMRTGALITVVGGVTILVGGAFNLLGNSVVVTAEHALWMIGIALTGKFLQRGQETKQAMGHKEEKKEGV